MHCPVCESPRLTAPHTYNSFDNAVHIPDGKQGRLGPKRLAVAPSLARICGDCGYVMLFLDAPDLERIQPCVHVQPVGEQK